MPLNSFVLEDLSCKQHILSCLFITPLLQVFFDVVFWLQAVMLLFIGLFVEYGSDCDISKKIDGENNNNLYATYQDVHVMMFIGEQTT